MAINQEPVECGEAVTAARMRLWTITERMKFLVKRTNDDRTELEELRAESRPLIELCIAADSACNA